MPEICRFCGITITMYYNEHVPPHFHVDYNDCQATVDIKTACIKGKLPPRIAGLIVEWTLTHKVELLDNWNRALSRQSLKKIKPL